MRTACTRTPFRMHARMRAACVYAQHEPAAHKSGTRARTHPCAHSSDRAGVLSSRFGAGTTLARPLARPHSPHRTAPHGTARHGTARRGTARTCTCTGSASAPADSTYRETAASNGSWVLIFRQTANPSFKNTHRSVPTANAAVFATDLKGTQRRCAPRHLTCISAQAPKASVKKKVLRSAGRFASRAAGWTKIIKATTVTRATGSARTSGRGVHACGRAWVRACVRACVRGVRGVRSTDKRTTSQPRCNR